MEKRNSVKLIMSVSTLLMGKIRTILQDRGVIHQKCGSSRFVRGYIGRAIMDRVTRDENEEKIARAKYLS